MPRGQAAAVGATRIAKNGYHYTKCIGRNGFDGPTWVLTHWLTAEKARGGEQIDPDNEMVQFVDGFNKKDYDNPKAVRIIKKNAGSIRKRIAVVESRIEEYQAELRRLKAQLSR